MIGLFLGDKKLPLEILKKIKKNKKKYFIIDLTRRNKFKSDKHSYFIGIGKFGKILDLIKRKKCKKVLFAGNIEKPKITSLKLDLKGLYYIPRILKASKFGDAAILKELIKILSEHKIKVLKLNLFNPELTLSKGSYTKTKPKKFEHKNIIKGVNYLNKLSGHNHIQGLVIKNGIVIAKETKKGTKKMLQSIRSTKKFKGILIKLPKKKQDLRVDLPTVGIDTFKDCKKAGIYGVVLKTGQNIILDKKECINFANKNKIFVHVI